MVAIGSKFSAFGSVQPGISSTSQIGGMKSGMSMIPTNQSPYEILKESVWMFEAFGIEMNNTAPLFDDIKSRGITATCGC